MFQFQRETTSNAVQLLVKWLYCQKLELGENDKESETSPTVSNPFTSSFSASSSFVDSLAASHSNIRKIFRSLDLAILWVLADKLLIPELQNVAIRELAQRRERDSREFPPALSHIPGRVHQREVLFVACSYTIAPIAFAKACSKIPKSIFQ